MEGNPKSPRYVANNFEGSFSTVSELTELCKIIAKTPSDEKCRCFIAVIRGHDTFVYTHSHRTCALYSDNPEIKHVIEIESGFDKWPKYLQIFTLMHEIGHLELGHIDFITDHPCMHGLDVFKSFFFDPGNERIEVEADLYALKILRFKRDTYKKCIRLFKSQIKKKTSGRWEKDVLLKIMDGRCKHVLSEY